MNTPNQPPPTHFDHQPLNLSTTTTQWHWQQQQQLQYNLYNNCFLFLFCENLYLLLVFITPTSFACLTLDVVPIHSQHPISNCGPHICFYTFTKFAVVVLTPFVFACMCVCLFFFPYLFPFWGYASVLISFKTPIFLCPLCVCVCVCGCNFPSKQLQPSTIHPTPKTTIKPSKHKRNMFETNYSNAAVADDDNDDNDDDKNNDADGIRLMVSKMATITNPSPYRNYMDARLFCRLDLVFIVYITRPLTYTLYLSTICVCVCDSMSFWYLLIVSIHLLPLTFSFDMHLAFDVLCCCCG